MKTNTRGDIFAYIKTHKNVSVKKLVEKFQISPQMIHRHLNKLQQLDQIQKVGKPPKVFYIAKKQKKYSVEEVIGTDNRDAITNDTLETKTEDISKPKRSISFDMDNNFGDENYGVDEDLSTPNPNSHPVIEKKKIKKRISLNLRSKRKKLESHNKQTDEFSVNHAKPKKIKKRLSLNLRSKRKRLNQNTPSVNKITGF